MVQPEANGFFGLACFRTFNRHGRADCPLQLFHVSCKTLVTAAGLRYACVAVGRHRPPGNRVTFRKDMPWSHMRRRQLRPAFCMTGHSQQSAVDVRRKHTGCSGEGPHVCSALIRRPVHPSRRAIIATGSSAASPPQRRRPSEADVSYRSGWTQMQLAVDCGLRIVGRRSQIVDCPRQNENHQSHLHALEACRTSAGEPDGTIFLPSNSPAPFQRQLPAGRCSQ